MELFDFVTDTIGDVVGGIVDGVSDAAGFVGDVVNGVADTLGEIGGEVGVEEVVEDVVTTGTGVVVGTAAGIMGGVKKGMDRANQNNIVKDNLATEKDDKRCISTGNSQDRHAEDIGKSKIVIEESSQNVRVINVSPGKELWTGLKKLRDREDRQVDEIKRNGENIIANVTDAIFSSPKKNKLWGLAKSISGKTKEEKVREIIDDFDERRAKYIDRVIVPIDSDEMWEMYEIAIRLIKQPSLGSKETLACRNLLERVTEECEVRFIDDEAKMALIRGAKHKYLN